MPRRRSMNVDISEQQAEEFSVNDEVELRVRGKIKSVSLGEPPDKDFDGFPPDMSIEISKVRVRRAEENEFSDLARDEED